MRKIEQQMIQAIRAGKDWRSGNTEVRCNDRGVFTVLLHGNLIGERTKEGVVSITLAGWPTPTTRSRVNALLREFGRIGSCVFQNNGVQYFAQNGHEYNIGADECVTVQQ